MDQIRRRGSILALACVILASSARADIIIRTDGVSLDGKVISQNQQTVTFHPDWMSSQSQLRIGRGLIARVITTDDHGAILSDSAAPETQPAERRWNVPPEPAPPAVLPPPSGPSYYRIPLHGEVGETYVASALEQSLADALLRKPTVVVLEIDSPGGLVEEARRMIDILHHYNKKLRIVALTRQDLSASAIVSLSVREIYVEPSSTFGAATSFIPGSPNLSAKVEEKMQSAWRATARNSAEEGRHEPLLAEAMIDNDFELHLEKVDGKPAVKEGPGDRVLCRKGKILTLTSHEAVECGLAAGEADDVADLGETLHMAKWTEIKGLGTLLADSLPARAEAYKKEGEVLGARIKQDLVAAEQADPSQSVTTVTRIGPAVGPQPIRPGYPGRIYMGRSYGGQQTITQTRSRAPSQWKPDSLACVVALQRCEADFDDGIALAAAYGHESEVQLLTEAKGRFSAIRSTVYDNRNKYGAAVAGALTPPANVKNDPATRPTTRPNLPPGTISTAMIGGAGGISFSTVSTQGTPILGFHGISGEWQGKAVLRRLLPTANHPTTPATDKMTIMAKDGYVVSGLIVDADPAAVVAVKVIFAAYHNGHADAHDTYTSDWIGTPDDAEAKTLGGDGAVVLGIHGRRATNLDAVGLVLLPADAK